MEVNKETTEDLTPRERKRFSNPTRTEDWIKSTAKEPHLESLRILCFGDSLTSGYNSQGSYSDPYGEFLQERLRELLPTYTIDVDVQGFPGDQVQGAFSRRLKRELEATADTPIVPYDWIIILGGTNDLAWGRLPMDIYRDLENVWQHALVAGAKVLALSVIETADGEGNEAEKRKLLNSKIIGHRQENFFVFDLLSVIQYSTLTKDMRKLIYDDYVHLTKEGYKMMGHAVADHLHSILKGDYSQASQQSSHGLRSIMRPRSFTTSDGSPV